MSWQLLTSKDLAPLLLERTGAMEEVMKWKQHDMNVLKACNAEFNWKITKSNERNCS